MGLIAVVFMLYQGHTHSEATPTEAVNTEVSITVNIKVAMASELDLKITRVGKDHDLWDTAGLFGVKTRSQPMSFQLDRYMHILC